MLPGAFRASCSPSPRSNPRAGPFRATGLAVGAVNELPIYKDSEEPSTGAARLPLGSSDLSSFGKVRWEAKCIEADWRPVPAESAVSERAGGFYGSVYGRRWVQGWRLRLGIDIVAHSSPTSLPMSRFIASSRPTRDLSNRVQSVPAVAENALTNSLVMLSTNSFAKSTISSGGEQFWESPWEPVRLTLHFLRMILSSFRGLIGRKLCAFNCPGTPPPTTAAWVQSALAPFSRATIGTELKTDRRQLGVLEYLAFPSCRTCRGHSSRASAQCRLSFTGIASWSHGLADVVCQDMWPGRASILINQRRMTPPGGARKPALCVDQSSERIS